MSTLETLNLLNTKLFEIKMIIWRFQASKEKDDYIKGQKIISVIESKLKELYNLRVKIAQDK